MPPSPAYGGLSGEHFLLDFLDAARDGRPPLCPIEAGVHVLEIVEAALESVATGQTVQVGG
ncbi:MAG: Gfo/Idh/MocA family oxidoreductase [Chloroflexota bacterium]